MKRFVKDNISDYNNSNDGIVFARGEEVDIISCRLNSDCESGVEVSVFREDGSEEYLCASLLVSEKPQ